MIEWMQIGTLVWLRKYDDREWNSHMYLFNCNFFYLINFLVLSKQSAYEFVEYLICHLLLINNLNTLFTE